MNFVCMALVKHDAIYNATVCDKHVLSTNDDNEGLHGHIK